MSVSPRQLEANRRNAQLSTGPRTLEGKARVRLNAVKHGILSRETLITTTSNAENEDEFSALLDGLGAQLLPQGALEELLVQQIAGCYWRLRRIFRADALLFARDRAVPHFDSLAAINRYERTLQIQLDRAIKHLLTLQATRSATQPDSSPADDTPSPAEPISAKQTHFESKPPTVPPSSAPNTISAASSEDPPEKAGVTISPTPGAKTLSRSQPRNASLQMENIAALLAALDSFES